MSKPSHSDELIANPDKYFDSPKEVLDRASLTRQRKLAILRAMERRAQDVPTATKECQSAALNLRRKAIADAIRAVEQDRPG